MRDPERIDVLLDLLGEYWKLNPDMRLAQIIVNFARRPLGDSAPWVFYMEDDYLIELLEAQLESDD